jgi:hypothetical protein
MPDHRPQRRRVRGLRVHQNSQPLPHPRVVLSPEAHSRLAQQVARVLQRLRAEGTGRIEHVQ